MIYRIVYDGDEIAGGVSAAALADVMEQQAAEGVGVPLVLEHDETPAERGLTVTYQTTEPDTAIPEKRSDYADGVSPSPSWDMIEGAASYAIIIKDSDAKAIPPLCALGCMEYTRHDASTA